ncbi:hypothetical protein Tco_0780129 [Tanacetum coccineum]
MTTPASLSSPVSDDDVVHYVMDGLPEMYNQSKLLVTPVDSSSSSPMVLLADSVVHESVTNRDSNNTPKRSTPVAYTANTNSAPLYYSAQQVSPYVLAQPAQYVAPPPGFAYPPAHHQMIHQPAHPLVSASLPAGPVLSYQPAQTPNIPPQQVYRLTNVGSVQQAQPSAPLGFVTRPADNMGQATMHPQAFTVLLRCDSMGDLYPVTAPYPIPHAFLVSQHTWHERLGHLGSEVLRHGIINLLIYDAVDNDVNDVVDHVNEDEWLKESLRKLGRMTKNVGYSLNVKDLE